MVILRVEVVAVVRGENVCGGGRSGRGEEGEGEGEGEEDEDEDEGGGLVLISGCCWCNSTSGGDLGCLLIVRMCCGVFDGIELRFGLNWFWFAVLEMQ